MPELVWQEGGGFWPEGIKPGGCIGIFAPAGPFKAPRFKKGLAILRSWGFRVKLPADIFKTERRYLAGSDECRLRVMADLMNDPEVEALMAARGGYGCQRLLPFLTEYWPNWPKKMIIGFSDITALHLARYKEQGLIGFHGPVLTSLGDCDASSLASLKKTFSGQLKNSCWVIPRRDILKPGYAHGPILGGNLTMVNALLASPWCPNYQNAILLIEDVGETAYRLDRLLFTLRTSHIWSKLSGLVFGRFINCANTRSINNLLREAASDFPGPVIINAPFSHGSTNRTFPIGALGTLEAR